MIQEPENKNNLSNEGISNITIYDVLKVANPRKFHLNNSLKKITDSYYLLNEAAKELRTAPHKKLKPINEKVVEAVADRIQTILWNIILVRSAIADFINMNMNNKIIASADAEEIINKLNDDEPII